MTPKTLYCFEEDSVEDAAKNMGKNQVRRLPVLNKDKRLVGIISLGDIVCKGSKPAAAEALFFVSQRESIIFETRLRLKLLKAKVAFWGLIHCTSLLAERISPSPRGVILAWDWRMLSPRWQRLW